MKDDDSVSKLLDEIDPLSDLLAMTLADDETIAEFSRWKPDCLWCPEIRSMVTPDGPDRFVETVGDEKLYRLMIDFNDGRRAWAREQMKKEVAEDKTRYDRAKRYLKYVTNANKASAIKAAVALFCKTRTIAASELNREPTVIGTPMGVVDMDMGKLLFDTDGYEGDGKRWRVTKSCRGNVESRLSPSLEYDERWDC